VAVSSGGGAQGAGSGSGRGPRDPQGKRLRFLIEFASAAKLKADILGVQSAWEKLSTTFNRIKDNLKQFVPQWNRSVQDVVQSARTLNASTKSILENFEDIDEVGRDLQRLHQIKLIDPKNAQFAASVSSAIAQLTTQFRQLAAAAGLSNQATNQMLQNVAQSAQQSTGKMTGILGFLSKWKGVLAGIGLAAGGMWKMLTGGPDLYDKFARVGWALGQTREQVKGLAIDMATFSNQSQIATEELVEMTKVAVQVGARGRNFNEFVKTSAMMAKVLGLSADEAAELNMMFERQRLGKDQITQTTQAMRGLSAATALTGREAAKVAVDLKNFANFFPPEQRDKVYQSFQVIAAQAKELGVDFEQVRDLMTRAFALDPQALRTMQMFGVTADDIKKAITSPQDAKNILPRMIDAAKQLSSAWGENTDMFMAYSKRLGERGVADMNLIGQLAGAGQQRAAEVTQAVGEAVKSTGQSLTDMTKDFMDTTLSATNATERFQNAWSNALGITAIPLMESFAKTIQIGTDKIRDMTGAAVDLNRVLEGMPDWAKSLLGAAGVASGPLAALGLGGALGSILTSVLGGLGGGVAGKVGKGLGLGGVAKLGAKAGAVGVAGAGGWLAGRELGDWLVGSDWWNKLFPAGRPGFDPTGQAEMVRPGIQGRMGEVPTGPFAKEIASAAQTTGVSEDLIRRVMQIESGGRPDVVSPKGAVGLMQMLPSTAKDMGVQDIFNPEQNIMGGAKYLAYLLKKYGGDEQKALAAYNWGMGNVDKTLAKTGGVLDTRELPAETQRYLAKAQALSQTASTTTTVVNQDQVVAALQTLPQQIAAALSGMLQQLLVVAKTPTAAALEKLPKGGEAFQRVTGGR
jgi:hypothetical protein